MEPKIHCLLFDFPMFIIAPLFSNNKYIMYTLTYLRGPKQSLIVKRIMMHPMVHLMRIQLDAK